MGTLYLTLLLLSLMASNGVMASGPLSADERAAAVSIVLVVGVGFVIFDAILILLLVYIYCQCYRASPSRKQEQRQDLNRSIEFIDAPVTLQFTKRHSSFNGSHRSSIHEQSEHSFNENPVKVDISKVPDVTVSIESNTENEEIVAKDKVFAEKHIHTPQHQTKRHYDEHRRNSHSRAVRKDSERYLLGSDDKSDEESIPSPINMEELKLESPVKEGEEFGSLLTGYNRDSKHSESPEPHLVSITSKLTGPIIPSDEPVGNVPREIQSLKFETVMEANNRKDSSVIEETSFDNGSGFFGHERSASELMEASIMSTGFTTMDNSFNQGNSSFPTGSGANDRFSKGSNDGFRSESGSLIVDHTNRVSLGYTDVLKTCQDNEMQITEMIRRSRENLEQPQQSSVPPEDPILQQSFPPMESQPMSSYQKYFNLSLSPNLSGSGEIPIIRERPLIANNDHQRSSSLSYSTPQHWPSEVVTSRQQQRIMQQNLLGSYSASNTPKHQPKFN